MKMKLIALAMIGGLLGGCADNSPPVERVPVAAPHNRDQRVEYDRPKPLPDNATLWSRDQEYRTENTPAANQPPKSPQEQNPATVPQK